MEDSLFQSTVCAVPWSWWPAKSYLSDCYSPVGLWDTSPLHHQGQVIQGFPLCRLTYLLALVRQLESVAGQAHSTHLPKASGKMSCLHVLTGFSNGARKSLVYL